MTNNKPRCTIVNNILFSDDEDEVDNFTFVNGFRARFPQPSTTQEQQKQLENQLEKKRRIEQRTLVSSARSIALLRESEEIGIHAAVKLADQGNQLHITNKTLDDIDANLKISQKHIKGIQSVFYGIKNILIGKADTLPIQSNRDVPRCTSQSHSTFYNAIEKPTQCIAVMDRPNLPKPLHGLDEQTSAEPVDSQGYDNILEANLNVMSSHVARLKGHGMAIGNELSHQIDLIDKIQDKVEVADIKIRKQNKEMNKILGKGFFP